MVDNLEPIMPERPYEVAHYAALEQRVTGLENSVSKVADAVTALGNKLDVRSTPQWSVLLTAIGIGIAILTAIGGLAYRPIDMAVQDTKEEFARLRATVVPRQEHERNWNLLDRDLLALNKRIERVESESIFNRKAIVNALPERER